MTSSNEEITKRMEISSVDFLLDRLSWVEDLHWDEYQKKI